MKISVVVPLYNVGSYVLRCLNSIINQTLVEGVECIIVNDCSTDKSLEIVNLRLSNYVGPISFHILHHEKNRGLAAARNTGLQAATGEYIIFIDSDDYCELTMLEEMYNKAVVDNADIIVADFYETYQQSDSYRIQTNFKSLEDYLENVISGNSIAALWNKLIKRSLFSSNNIRWVEGLNVGEDYYSATRICLCAKKITAIPKAYVHYVRYNENSYTKNMNKRTFEDVMTVIEYVISYFQQRNVYKKYETFFMYRKILLKRDMIFISSGKLQKQWIYLYPEATPYIMSCSMLTLYSRFFLWIACYKCLPIYNFMRYLWEKKHYAIDKIS